MRKDDLLFIIEWILFLKFFLKMDRCFMGVCFMRFGLCEFGLWEFGLWESHATHHTRCIYAHSHNLYAHIRTHSHTYAHIRTHTAGHGAQLAIRGLWEFGVWEFGLWEFGGAEGSPPEGFLPSVRARMCAYRTISK